MSNKTGRAVNLTEGKLIKPLLTLSLPIILTNLMQVGYNLADTFWVGRLGQDAVSALSFSWPLIFLVISLAGGLSVAGTVLVAQNKGAGNHERVNHVAGQTIAFVFLLSLALSTIGFLIAPTLLKLIGATPQTNIFQYSVEYTRTMFMGIPFVFGFFIFQALLQGWGDTRTPMYLMALGVVLNIIIDPIFILGFKNNVLFGILGLRGVETALYQMTGFTGFGVQGAAIATVLSRGLGAIIAITLLISGHVGIHIKLEDFKLKMGTVKKILEIGTPSSIDQTTRAVGVTMLTAIVALAGDPAVAAFGIGNRLNSMVFLPAMGFARGTNTMVGQNLGSDQVDRAKKTVYAAATIITLILLIITAIFYLNANTIVNIFITGEESATVINLGAEYLRTVGLTFVFLGIFRVFQGGFRGSGSTKIAMTLSILSLLGLRVPISYLLLNNFNMGATGVWYGVAISNIITAIIAVLWFLRGTWQERVVEKEEEKENPPKIKKKRGE